MQTSCVHYTTSASKTTNTVLYYGDDNWYLRSLVLQTMICCAARCICRLIAYPSESVCLPPVAVKCNPIRPWHNAIVHTRLKSPLFSVPVNEYVHYAIRYTNQLVTSNNGSCGLQEHESWWNMPYGWMHFETHNRPKLHTERPTWPIQSSYSCRPTLQVGLNLFIWSCWHVTTHSMATYYLDQVLTLAATSIILELVGTGTPPTELPARGKWCL